MSYVPIKDGDLVLVQDGNVYVSVTVGKIVGQPTDKTCQVSTFRRSGEFEERPSRRDRGKIAGVLRPGTNPEVAAKNADYFLGIRQSKIKQAKDEFEANIKGMVV